MESDFPFPSDQLRSFPNPTSQPLRLIICLGKSCCKYSAKGVFANFKANLPPNIELISAMCLGECGNGSMVLVEPDQVWYSQVNPDEVIKVIQQHLVEQIPVQEMLYSKFHS